MSNQKGMTLIEVLAALSISGLVMGMIFSVFTVGMSSFHKQSNTNQVRSDADYVMTVISNTFYEKHGELSENEVIINKNGKVVLNGKPISQSNLDYTGSTFIFDPDENMLKVTLKAVPKQSETADPFVLETTLTYPW